MCMKLIEELYLAFFVLCLTTFDWRPAEESKVHKCLQKNIIKIMSI